MQSHPADWFPARGFPYPSFSCSRGEVLYRDVCDCDDCVRLKKAAGQIDDINWYEGDDAANVVAGAQKAMWEARKRLHELHAADRHNVKEYGRHLEGIPRGEMYIKSELEWDGGFDGGIGGCEGDFEEQYDDMDPYDSSHWYSSSEEEDDAKFMICDHCRGHALPCNEDAVCEQCELSGTVCVHRWCGHGRGKIRKHCDKPKCRYVHKDYLPTDPDKYSRDDYVILPGFLRDYLADGQLLPLDPPTAPDDIDIICTPAACKVRQQEAREEIERWEREDNGPLCDIPFSCGPYCGKHSLEEEEIASGDEFAGSE